jgi:uncharacterized membrane protein YedE/YeeE
MAGFTPVSALIGGVILGIVTCALMLTHGRVLGISGIFAGLMHPPDRDGAWRWAFVAGLVVGGFALVVIDPAVFDWNTGRSIPMVALGGALVGFGTRLGSGCTSGHGLCGLSRFSVRSLVAVCVFMAVGVATATLVRVIGGAS